MLDSMTITTTSTTETTPKQRPRASATTNGKRGTRPQSDDGSEGGDYDDDGAEADAEFSDVKSGWVNVSARRKSVQNASLDPRGPGATFQRQQRETEEARRHSIAV